VLVGANARDGGGLMSNIIKIDSVIEIPEDLNNKNLIIKQAIAGGRQLSGIIAMVVADARRNNFAKGEDWLVWGERMWSWSRPHLHHMRQVGELLLRSRGNSDRYELLLRTDASKLLAVARLDDTMLAEWLSRNNITTMTRDDVRMSVASWLGETEPEKIKANKKQGDFFGMLDNFIASAPKNKDKIIASKRVKAIDALTSGIIMLDIAAAKYQAETCEPAVYEAVEQACQDLLQNLAHAKTRGDN
jgi:hypothetical protein